MKAARGLLNHERLKGCKTLSLIFQGLEMKFKSTSPIFALMLLCSMFLSSPIFAASAQIANDEKIAPEIDLTNSAGYQRASALEREATNLTELAKQVAFQQVSASEAKEVKQIAKILAQTEKNPVLLAEEANRAVKTVNSLAQEINGKRQIGLRNKNIWQLDFRALVETSKNAKEARARMKAARSHGSAEDS